MKQNVLGKITKRIGEFDVIQPFDLFVEEGEFVSFVGPSGCERSTLLRLEFQKSGVWRSIVEVSERLGSNISTPIDSYSKVER